MSHKNYRKFNSSFPPKNAGLLDLQAGKHNIRVVKCITSGNFYDGLKAAAKGEEVAWTSLANAMRKGKNGEIVTYGDKQWQYIT